MSVRRDVWIIAVTERDRRVVHRSDHIAGEDDFDVVERGFCGKLWIDLVVLRPPHRLGGHHVWPGAKPPARRRAPVKIYQESIIRRILEDTEIVLDHDLFLADEEIDLDPLYSPVGQLGHLRAPDRRVPHLVPGTE